MWSSPQGAGDLILELTSGTTLLVLSVKAADQLLAAVTVEVIVGHYRGWIWIVRDNVVARRFRLLSA